METIKKRVNCQKVLAIVSIIILLASLVLLIAEVAGRNARVAADQNSHEIYGVYDITGTKTLTNNKLDLFIAFNGPPINSHELLIEENYLYLELRRSVYVDNTKHFPRVIHAFDARITVSYYNGDVYTLIRGVNAFEITQVKELVIYVYRETIGTYPNEYLTGVNVKVYENGVQLPFGGSEDVCFSYTQCRVIQERGRIVV